MTSLAVWISVDSKSVAALYFASDSRVSWGSKWNRWDAGRKLFFCRKTPDLFGFAGDVTFSSLTLTQICEAADAGIIFGEDDDSTARHAKFIRLLAHSFNHRHNAPKEWIHILHGSRQGSGKQAIFRIWRTTFHKTDGSMSDQEIIFVPDRSKLIASLGSGTNSIKSHVNAWDQTEQGGTSRAIFGAFCDSIGSDNDPLSGGAPQLVGMYHTRLPQNFGVVVNGRRFLNGLEIANASNFNAVEWRDDLFQRVDGDSLDRLADAQRHIRPRSI
jgi:hypothetical protein